MDFTLEIVLDEEAKVPRLVLHAASLTKEVTQLAQCLQRLLGSEGEDKGSGRRLLGYRDEETVLLEPKDIYSFFTQGQTVQVRTRFGTMRVKQRLYELEELLDPEVFLRVSHSELVNFEHVKSFEVAINGSINLRFTDGGSAYVSRRNLKTIKHYLGL
jgi:DNA-binding LytR/AlgR family response regulator